MCGQLMNYFRLQSNRALPSAETHDWWSKHTQDGAVLLGAHAHKALTFATAPA